MNRIIVSTGFFLGFFFLITLGGCPDDSPKAPSDALTPKHDIPPPSDIEEEKVQEPKAVEEKPEAFIVAAAAGLRRLPTMERHVQIDEDGPRLPNWLLTLYRGDMVNILKTETKDGEEWSRVSFPGENEGWLKTEWILPSDGLKPATSLEELRVFDLPDHTRPRAGQSIDAGTYLIVMGEDGDFSRVNHVSQRTAWVRTRDLTSDEKETGASRVISRVRWLKSRNETEGLDVLAEGAREAFSGAILLNILETEIKVE